MPDALRHSCKDEEAVSRPKLLSSHIGIGSVHQILPKKGKEECSDSAKGSKSTRVVCAAKVERKSTLWPNVWRKRVLTMDNGIPAVLTVAKESGVVELSLLLAAPSVVARANDTVLSIAIGGHKLKVRYESPSLADHWEFLLKSSVSSSTWVASFFKSCEHGDVISNNNSLVRLARNRRTGTAMVIKTTDLYLPQSTDFSLSEAMVINRLLGAPQNANVLNYNAVFQLNERVYIVSQFCQGGSLFSFVQRNGQLSEASSAVLIKQVIMGLNHLHSLGVVHLDVKPENILLDRSRGGVHVRLSDLGSAKFYGCDRYEKDIQRMSGTPGYMAPEVCDGKDGWLAPSADIFSAGVVLYNMLTGEQPFQVHSPSNISRSFVVSNNRLAHVSPCCASLVAEMLELDPRKRIRGEQVLEHPWIQRYTGLEDGWKSLMIN